LRFDEYDVRFELRGVRCGLPTIREFAPIQSTKARSPVPIEISEAAVGSMPLG
jgi:hypothetical protein